MSSSLRDFVLQGMELQRQAGSEYDRNMEHCGVESASGEALASLLERRMSLWRPWDTRLYMALQGVRGYQNTPSELSQDLVSHLKVSVVGRGVNALEYGIHLNSAMPLFKDYCRKVADSVDKSAGVDVGADGRVRFGAGATVHGGIARTPSAPSPHLVDVPESPYADDMLREAVPSASWSLKAVVHIGISLGAGGFTLAYLVRGDKGVLLSGSETSPNLSEACGLVWHQVFGSAVPGKGAVDYHDGLRQLLSGEKAGMPSEAQRYAGLAVGAMHVSKWSLVLGLGTLGIAVLLGGWDVSYVALAVGSALAFVGHVGSAVAVPILEAGEVRAAKASL